MHDAAGPVAQITTTGVVCWAVVLLLLGVGALLLGYTALRQGCRLRVKVFGFYLEVWPRPRRQQGRN